MTSGYFNKAYTINILIHNTYFILRKKKQLPFVNDSYVKVILLVLGKCLVLCLILSPNQRLEIWTPNTFHFHLFSSSKHTNHHKSDWFDNFKFTEESFNTTKKGKSQAESSMSNFMKTHRKCFL